MIEDTQVTVVTSGMQVKRTTKRLDNGAECAICNLAGEEATYIVFMLEKQFEAGVQDRGNQVTKRMLTPNLPAMSKGRDSGFYFML